MKVITRNYHYPLLPSARGSAFSVQMAAGWTSSCTAWPFSQQSSPVSWGCKTQAQACNPQALQDHLFQSQHSASLPAGAYPDYNCSSHQVKPQSASHCGTRHMLVRCCGCVMQTISPSPAHWLLLQAGRNRGCLNVKANLHSCNA